MKLVSVWLRRAPGLDKGIDERQLTPGLNVVFGPNESGKSTLARAIQATLWPEKKRPAELVDVETRWDHEGELWTARHDGATTWARNGEVCPAPSIPGPEYRTAYRLHLRDLIAGVGEADDEFAKRIRSTLDGGFDLSARVTPSRSTQHGRNDASALRAARKARDLLEGERQRLAADVEGLAALEAELAEAEAARGDEGALVTAERWHAARHDLIEADEWLRANDTPDDFTGRESGELDRLDGEIDAASRAITDLDAEIAEARSALAKAALPDALPSGAQMTAWAERSRRAVELARKLGELRRSEEKVAARARHAAVEAGVAGEAPPLFAPAPEEVARLAQWLDARERLDADRRALEATRRAWPERTDTDEEHERFAGVSDDALVQARGLVLTHLREGKGRAALWLGLAAVPAMLLPMLAGPRLETLPPWAAPLAMAIGAVLGVGLAAWLVRRHAAAGLRRGLAGLGVEQPEGAPAKLLDDLDEAVRARRVAGRAAERRRELDDRFAELEERATALEPLRADLLQRLALEADVDDLTLVEAARRFADHRAAQHEWTAARGEREAVESELGALSGALASELARWATIDSADADVLAAHVADLRSRIDIAEAARKSIDGHEQRRAIAVERREGLLRERADLIAGLGLEPSDLRGAHMRLAAWNEALPTLREWKERCSGAVARMKGLEADLGERASLLELDLEEVQRRRAAAQQASSRVAEVSTAIGRVRGEVQAAERSHDVEAASAAVDAAHEVLELRRQEVIEDVAARLLLDEVSADIDRDQRPEVLQRAAGFFERFTGHRYALHVDDDGDRGARFTAIDHHSGSTKQLRQLSDGTRMQLLLAARLAFVHEGEALVHPPLILDEALSSSDTERMRQVTDALVHEVEHGRQVFYMTNDPGDVADWRAACERAGVEAPNVIRLDEPPTSDRGSFWEGLPAAAERTPVPAPGGLSAAQYAARLGVPAPDAWASLGELHLFHLLRDDLDALHRLLDEAHVDRLGRLRALARSGAIEGLFGAGFTEKIEARARVADRFFAAWRVGRGQRLRRGDIDACDAVSEAFKDRFKSLVEDPDVSGDARILMARIIENKDERVKRFQRKNRDELEAWLLERGFLSEADVLDDDAIVHEVVAQVGDVIVGAGEHGVRERLADVHALVRDWLDVMHHVEGITT